MLTVHTGSAAPAIAPPLRPLELADPTETPAHHHVGQLAFKSVLNFHNHAGSYQPASAQCQALDSAGVLRQDVRHCPGAHQHAICKIALWLLSYKAILQQHTGAQPDLHNAPEVEASLCHGMAKRGQHTFLLRTQPGKCDRCIRSVGSFLRRVIAGEALGGGHHLRED